MSLCRKEHVLGPVRRKWICCQKTTDDADDRAGEQTGTGQLCILVTFGEGHDRCFC